MNDIDFDYVKKAVGKDLSGESLLIHRVTKLDLKYDFDSGRGAKIRRVPESDRTYQGNTLH